ncbi:NINE protein [uncultured Mucilaginibacter sp.]|uniref:NINE protein n=1 Tax=uncultured Mucilaginibacter sp. TaxID=797541 RepID=UPI0025E87E30|nr:NINE protein [uncultured Mucilaginibacter sp.]
MFENPNFAFPGATYEEIAFLRQAVTGLTESQMSAFQLYYSSKRKSESDMLMYCIIGFATFLHGFQRFMIGQIGMGLLFFFTLGFCFIGSIVDLANHKTLALEYNKEKAFECYQMAKLRA